MSEADALLADACARLFAQHAPPDVADAAEQGAFPAALWSALDAAGMLAVLASKEPSAVADAMTLLRAAGAAGAPGPLLDHVIAAHLLHRAGIGPPAGPLTLARGDGASGTVRVNWAADAQVVAHVDGRLTLLRRAQVPAGKRATSMAGEPTALLRLDVDAEAQAPSDATAEEVECLGALGRAAQMAGAMSGALDLAVAYVNTRAQFGRPLAKFQAIQHQLAVLAEEAASAGVAVDLAVAAWPGDAALRRFAVGAAKIRAGEAAGAVARIAHQVHGAMGFTHEYRLHHLTRRLWTWRDDFGAESVWAERLGRQIAAGGGAALWPLLARG
ncbi:MAG: acyl-CoA dehydrogenase [Alphaproteobacteria bacterium]|nr:acyl-CoA dehydrogenase [Alphaproteobacteria bacterium]